MPNVQRVSFTTPGSEYAAEQAEIERRMRMAEALQERSMSPDGGTQFVGGWAMPKSPLESLAKGAQGAFGAYQQKQAGDEQKELAKRMQGDYQQMLAKGLKQLYGSPAGQISEDPSGNVSPAQPAVPADPVAALGTFGSHPMGERMDPLAMQEMTRQRLAQALRGGAPQAGPAPQPGPGGASGGAPSAPQMQTGGPAGGIPMEAWLAIPGGEKAYLEQLAKDRAPVIQREGPIWRQGPNGLELLVGPKPNLAPGVQPTGFGPRGEVTGAKMVPGYGTAIEGLEGAQERGKAPYRFRDVPTGGGATQLMRESDIPGAPPSPQPPAQLPSGPDALARVRAQGGTVEYNPADFGRIPMVPKVGRSQTTSQRAESQEVGKGLGDYYNTATGNAAKAATGNRYLDNMEMAVQDFTPGKLTPLQSSLTQWAQALGIPVSEQDKKAAGSIQALTSMAIKMAGAATRQSDAQPSQLQYFKILESMPNETRTPEGFKKIIDYMRDAHNYDIAKLQHLEQWRREHGGTSEGFEAAWPKMADSLPFVWNRQRRATDLKAIVNSGKQNDPLGLRK